MSQRSPIGVAPAALAASAVLLCGLGACASDPEVSPCLLAPTPLAVNPLTAMTDVRLDRSGEGLFLLGTDGRQVLWARLGLDGKLGEVHSTPVPEHRDGPWFAMAGTSAVADRVVVAFTTTEASLSSTLPSTRLWTFSAATDGGGIESASPPVVVATIPDSRAFALEVDMASGRDGFHAGLAWAVRGAPAIFHALVLDGTGAALASPPELPPAVDDFDCLRFLPGQQDLTLGYVDLSGTPPAPAFVMSEIDAQGSNQSQFRLELGDQMPGCVELASTDYGYGLAWHTLEGTHTGGFQSLPDKVEFWSDLAVGDVRLPGAPASLHGLAFTGKDFALVVARDSGVLESWRVDGKSRRLGGPLRFPSTTGRTGAVPSRPLGNALYATYLDGSTGPAGDPQAHGRFLVKVTCP